MTENDKNTAEIAQAEKVANAAKRAAATARTKAKQAPAAAKEKARKTVRKAAETGKQETAEAVEGYRKTTQTAAIEAEASGRPEMARGLLEATQSLARIEYYLKTVAPRALAHDTARYVRRHRSVALPAFFLAGMAVARFLKAGPPSDRKDVVS